MINPLTENEPHPTSLAHMTGDHPVSLVRVAGTLLEMVDDPVQQLREVCLALPEVTERLNHGEPAWAVRGKTLVTFSERKPEGRVGFWCPAPPGDLEAMVAAQPQRFFQPPHGGRGWLGVYLDIPVDWMEIQEIITEAYRMIAPKKLVAELG